MRIRFKADQVLVVLIMLEVIVLFAGVKYFIRGSLSTLSIRGLVVIFTISVVAAALGLRLLTALTRRHGQDLITRFRVLC